ncbi:MAG TPA: class I SAM-dependent methyltransferase [Pyrinomonadaceae bacterium]|nr:class I SAM-dependent methyltransferase [Pyrinomonadaceae bacterium]
MSENGKYIPALSFDWLTPLYDPLVKWLMPETKFKTRLVRDAQIQAGHRVLDLGCGTATLTLLIKQIHPDAEVVGLDGDDKILNIARRKVAQSGAAVTLQRALAFALPYADGSFDRVLSSMVLHHLTPDDKRRTLAEVSRVLGPRGEFHVVDFRRQNKSLPGMFRETGFARVEEYAEYATLFGTLALWRARRVE